MAGQNILGGKTKLNTGIKKVESGRHYVADKGDRCQNITGKPQPHNDLQINRNGLD